MVKSCTRCAGLYTTIDGEFFAGTPCRCLTPEDNPAKFVRFDHAAAAPEFLPTQPTKKIASALATARQPAQHAPLTAALLERVELLENVESDLESRLDKARSCETWQEERCGGCQWCLNKHIARLEKALSTARQPAEKVEALKQALMGVSTFKLMDGSYCWCAAGTSYFEDSGTHEAACEAARQLNQESGMKDQEEG